MMCCRSKSSAWIRPRSTGAWTSARPNQRRGTQAGTAPVDWISGTLPSAHTAAEFCVDALREMAAIHQEVGAFRSFWSAAPCFTFMRLELRPVSFALGPIQNCAHGWWTRHPRRAGRHCMHDWQVDPVSARRIHPNDTQRIQVALEIYELTAILHRNEVQ